MERLGISKGFQHEIIDWSPPPMIHSDDYVNSYEPYTCIFYFTFLLEMRSYTIELLID